MGKRGPKSQYDFTTLQKVTIKTDKLASFKTLLSNFNSGKKDDDKLVFEYEFKNNKVLAQLKTA